DLLAIEAQIAFETFQAFGIHLHHPSEILERAWYFAQRFNRPTVYDSYYLAVGDLFHCEVWTADRRLHLAVNGSLPWVKLLRDYRPAAATS
ncbi:MAG: type II toxin-antitoxin system VapC family toxin, partial [Caldilineaceae bacterium]